MQFFIFCKRQPKTAMIADCEGNKNPLFVAPKGYATLRSARSAALRWLKKLTSPEWGKEVTKEDFTFCEAESAPCNEFNAPSDLVLLPLFPPKGGKRANAGRKKIYKPREKI